MTVSAAIIDVAPEAKATAKAVIPPATNVNPAPIPSIPTPSNTNAPANPNIGTIKGFSKSPATPIIAKAPAKTIKPLAISPQLNLPSVDITGAITAKAAEATNNAEAPPKVPFISFRPIANSANAQPIAIRPFPMLPHLIPPKSDNTLANTLSEATATNNPAALKTDPLGIIFIVIANSANAIPIAVRPLAILFQLVAPKSDNVLANILSEAAINTMDIPVRATCLAFPAIFSKTEISRSSPPIADSPLPISPQLKVARSLHAEASILIATDNAIRPTEPFTILEPVLDMTTDTATNSQRRAEIAVKPTDICSQLKLESDFKAEASIRIATDIPIILTAVVSNSLLLPPNLFINAIEPTSSANKAVIATMAVPNESLSIVESTYNAAAKIAIATAIFFNASAFNCF